MKIGKWVLLAAMLPCVATPTYAAEKAHPLSPDEIKTLFATGKAFSASTPGGRTVAMTLSPDGKAVAVPKGEKKGNKGKWRLSDTGYCTKWGRSPERCYTVQKRGDGYDVLGPSGTVVAHWTMK
jgi:hypothetical protein